MEVAQATTALRLGMAERYEVVIDFTSLAGRTVVLNNLRPKNNVEYPTTGSVMQFQVGRSVTSRANNGTVPGKTLRARPSCMGLVQTGSTPTRTFTFQRANGHWTINGKTWADVVSSGFTATLAKPRLNDVEVWTISNPSGGWFHPVHIHLIDFQILSRTGDKRSGVQPFERGPKDVVYVGESETVQIIARFGPQAGRYMIHCHNLVHEDHDMMHQFWVEAPGDSPVEDCDPMCARAADHASDGGLFLPDFAGIPAQYPPPEA
jgi:FtsP/CotA-like multicopper oxidase with cupredoxin domain